MPEIIETSAGQVAAELQRRGVAADERVTLMIDAERNLFSGRRESHRLVVAAGLSDADIDRLIARAREDITPRPK